MDRNHGAMFRDYVHGCFVELFYHENNTEQFNFESKFSTVDCVLGSW